MYLAALLLTAILILLVVLDATKRLPLLGIFGTCILLFLFPHAVFSEYLLTVYLGKAGAPTPLQIYILIMLSLFFLYFWVKLNIIPPLKKQPDKLRLQIMLGGRQLTYYGLCSLLMQIPIYLFVFPFFSYLPNASLMTYIDIGFMAIAVGTLLFNGILRILCTSRRLGIVRRLVIIFTFWIPVLNIFTTLYAGHIARLEYDHEEYKVLNHQARVDSQICKTKYPLVMVHGVGFRDLKYVNYWGRIPKELIRNGATVYYGHQEAWGTIEANAADIKTKIMEIINQTGCEKVNIIAHSKGGLDARYMISTLDMGDFVASLTTMSSPHRGSNVIDTVSNMPDGLYQFIAKLVNRFFRKVGDKNPDFYVASKQFRTDFAKRFNEEVLDMPQVYYQSYASVMKSQFSDSLLCIPFCIVKPSEGQNDGLVGVESAKWGNFRGILRNNHRRGISHGDIIDLKREDYKGFDVVEKYIEIVSELKQNGF